MRSNCNLSVLSLCFLLFRFSCERVGGYGVGLILFFISISVHTVSVLKYLLLYFCELLKINRYMFTKKNAKSDKVFVPFALKLHSAFKSCALHR